MVSPAAVAWCADPVCVCQHVQICQRASVMYAAVEENHQLDQQPHVARASKMSSYSLGKKKYIYNNNK